MKKLIDELIFGKSSLAGGLVAVAVVAAIGMGCFCGKDKLGRLTNTDATAGTPSPTASAAPSPSAPKQYKKADASKAEIPSTDEMQDIVRRTLLDFNDALIKKDFADFHRTISKTWQKQITPEKMQESFQGFIDGGTNFAEIRSMDASFENAGEITRSTGVKTLETKGKYLTQPKSTEFELKYIAEGKEWKLIGIKVYAGVRK